VSSDFARDMIVGRALSKQPIAPVYLGNTGDGKPPLRQ
jgi:hypothetical protein